MPNLANIRVDIQILRAIAVLLVFACHAGLELFSGGYVGVDIFFVISGYVITLNILRNRQESAKNLLLQFYTARLLRLLPALTFMLVVCSVASLVLLAPIEQINQYSTAIGANFWVSNLVLLFQETGYFGPEASNNLYLHTWSLGVEEQFYLVWPVLILFGLGYFANTVRGDNYQNLLYVFIVCAAGSLALSLVLGKIEPNFAFYMMPARAWQFAIGAAIALYHFQGKLQASNRTSISLTIIGITLIAISATAFNDQHSYPSWRALIPTLGAALLLMRSTSSNTSIINILGKPLTIMGKWLGDISYSFYLWHWPVLLFIKYYPPTTSNFDVAISITVTTLFASLSYYCVEQPTRRLKIKASRIKAITASTAALFACFGLLSYCEKISVDWTSDSKQREILAAKNELSSIYQAGCDTWYFSSDVTPCVSNVENATKTVIMIGDSVLAQWWPAIQPYFNKRGWNAIILTKSSCPMINHPIYYERIRSIYTICEQWRKKAIAFIKKKNPEILILGSSLAYKVNNDEWLHGSKSLLDSISGIGQIIVIGGTPRLQIDVPTCLARKLWVNHTIDFDYDCKEKKQTHPFNSILLDLAKKYPNINFIDSSETVCKNNLCGGIINQTISYRDGQHVTYQLASKLSHYIGEKILVSTTRAENNGTKSTNGGDL